MKTNITKSKLGLLDIKGALWDERFRAMFPEYEKEMKEFIKNPGCTCNVQLYRSLLSHKDRLQKYFPTKEIESTQEEIERLAENRWKVINCHVDDLEKELRKLSKGRKQVVIARDREMVTCVINELDIIY